MKRILIVSILCILSLAILLICSKCVSNADSDVVPIVELAFCPTGTLDATYYFILTDDSRLIVEKGLRNGNSLNNKPFIIRRLVDKKERALSSVEFNNITNLIDEIYDSQSNIKYELWLDSWDIQILYNGMIIKDSMFECSYEIQKLIDIIVNISPIEVDYYSFS